MYQNVLSLASAVAVSLYAYVDLVSVTAWCLLSDFFTAAFVIGLNIPNKHNKNSPVNPLIRMKMILQANEKSLTSPIRYPIPSILFRENTIFN